MPLPVLSTTTVPRLETDHLRSFPLLFSIMDSHHDPFLISPHLFMLPEDHSINSAPMNYVSPSSPSSHRKKYEGFGDMIDDDDDDDEDDLKANLNAPAIPSLNVEYDPYKSFTLHDLDADPGTTSPLNDMDDDDDDDIVSVHEDKMSISDADTDINEDDDNADAQSTHAQASSSVSPPPAEKPVGRTVARGKATVYIPSEEDVEDEEEEPTLSTRDDDDSDFSAVDSDTQDEDEEMEDDEDTDGSYGRPSIVKKRRGAAPARRGSSTPRRAATGKSAFTAEADPATTDLTTLFATHTPSSLARLAKVEYTPSRTKLYICPVASCARPFTRRFNLATHTQTHDPSRPRPFACPKCTRTFVREHDLARHATVHASSKHHACPSCNTRFSRRDALRRHLARRGECRGGQETAGAVVGEARRGRRKVGERGVVKTEREILWEDPVARGVIESAVRTQEELAKKVKKEK